MNLSLRMVAATAILALVATACGGASNDSLGGVASLENAASAGTDSDLDGGADSSLSAEDAALAFSQCMRDEGLDFPDVGVNAQGNPDLGQAFQSADIQPGSDEFRTAMDACQPLLGDAAFGGRSGGGLEGNVEVQDAFVEFSGCIRDEGFDVGDLSFGGPGSGREGGDADTDGDGPRNRPGGQGEGGFGDPSAFIAGALGLDSEDPEVQAALEECQPILTQAFQNFGPGANENDG